MIVLWQWPRIYIKSWTRNGRFEWDTFEWRHLCRHERWCYYWWRLQQHGLCPSHKWALFGLRIAAQIGETLSRRRHSMLVSVLFIYLSHLLILIYCSIDRQSSDLLSCNSPAKGHGRRSRQEIQASCHTFYWRRSQRRFNDQNGAYWCGHQRPGRHAGNGSDLKVIIFAYIIICSFRLFWLPTTALPSFAILSDYSSFMAAGPICEWPNFCATFSTRISHSPSATFGSPSSVDSLLRYCAQIHNRLKSFYKEKWHNNCRYTLIKA